ncbi:Protein abil3 [Dionaea muscipula]
MKKQVARDRTKDEGAPTNPEGIQQNQALIDSNNLGLKNLRTQLYSAAEYFELSYTNDEQKQIVVDTLKDYAIKALVNTVDHLGSVSYKVNDLLDEKVEEVSGTEFRVSCIEQVHLFSII